MKQIKTFSLAFTYVGCFLGAGFISGQELWQFFGAFGNWGYVGFVLAALLFTVIGILFVRLTQMTKCAEMDKLLVPWDVKWLRAATGVIGALFLFFVVVSMSAGVGAMLTQLFRVPTWLGSAVFMLAVFLVALLGVSGMVNAFSAMIPILVLATVGFAVGAWCTFGTEGILQLQYTNTNPLMPNWFIATLTFVAYNILGGIGIMSPVGQYVREKKHVYVGIALSGVMLLAVAGSILTSLGTYPEAVQAELPMVGVGLPAQRYAGYDLRHYAAGGHVLQRSGQSGGHECLCGAEVRLCPYPQKPGVAGSFRAGLGGEPAGVCRDHRHCLSHLWLYQYCVPGISGHSFLPCQKDEAAAAGIT